MNTPDTPPTSPESPATAREWLSVAAAAARLGVSARAIQKRCASGKMAARRVAVPGGVRWEVDAGELGRERTNEPANLGREQDANSGSFGSRFGSFDAQEGANLDANPRADGREPDANTRELLAREREFSAFLKAQLEEANRNAAELRAALRKALEIAPRQLAAPSPVGQVGTGKSGEVGTSWNGHASARSAQNGAAHRDSQQPTNDAESGLKREGSPVSYGSIADELERMLNR